jgi:hypothetical protein
MQLLDYSLPNPSKRTMVQESAQLLTEMNTSDLPEGKARPERKADNLTTI